MGTYADQILPRLIDWGMSGRPFRELREKVAGRVSGTVLEVGFGSGRNLPYLGAGVERLFAVDPATLGRKLAARRLEASPVPVEFVGLEGERIPLGDASVDAVLSTWTLCTIPGVERALSEIQRLLRPGGRFHFLEHGISPDGGVARWQRRLNGMQMFFFGGCRLDRPVDRLIRDAGFEIERLDNYYMAGPKSHAYMFDGEATVRSAARD